MNDLIRVLKREKCLDFKMIIWSKFDHVCFIKKKKKYPAFRQVKRGVNGIVHFEINFFMF